MPRHVGQGMPCLQGTGPETTSGLAHIAATRSSGDQAAGSPGPAAIGQSSEISSRKNRDARRFSQARGQVPYR